MSDKAREACPDFGGDPRWIHWSLPDPAASGDTDADSYPIFQATAAEIDSRIRYLLPTLTVSDSDSAKGVPDDNIHRIRQRPLPRR